MIVIKQVIETNGYKDNLLSISFVQENPTVINDERLTSIAIKTLNNIYGNGFVVSDYGQIPFFNDDFAYFQQKISGVYFLLGGSNLKKGIIAMNHSPNFKVDEECIRVGVKSFSSEWFLNYTPFIIMATTTPMSGCSQMSNLASVATKNKRFFPRSTFGVIEWVIPRHLVSSNPNVWKIHVLYSN